MKFKSLFHWNQRKISSKNDFEENHFFDFFFRMVWSSNFQLFTKKCTQVNRDLTPVPIGKRLR